MLIIVIHLTLVLALVCGAAAAVSTAKVTVSPGLKNGR
jgi:hypothetical protein